LRVKLRAERGGSNGVAEEEMEEGERRMRREALGIGAWG
jgi:hypothetical protein